MSKLLRLALVLPLLGAQWQVGQRPIAAPSSPSTQFTNVASGSATAASNAVTTGTIACASGNVLLLGEFSYDSTATGGDSLSATTTTGNLVSSVPYTTQVGAESISWFVVLNCNGTSGTYTITNANTSATNQGLLWSTWSHAAGTVIINSANKENASGASLPVAENNQLLANFQGGISGTIGMASGWTSLNTFSPTIYGLQQVIVAATSGSNSLPFGSNAALSAGVNLGLDGAGHTRYLGRAFLSMPSVFTSANFSTLTAACIQLPTTGTDSANYAVSAAQFFASGTSGSNITMAFYSFSGATGTLVASSGVNSSITTSAVSYTQAFSATLNASTSYLQCLMGSGTTRFYQNASGVTGSSKYTFTYSTYGTWPSTVTLTATSNVDAPAYATIGGN